MYGEGCVGGPFLCGEEGGSGLPKHFCRKMESAEVKWKGEKRKQSGLTVPLCPLSLPFPSPLLFSAASFVSPPPPTDEEEEGSVATSKSTFPPLFLFPPPFSRPLGAQGGRKRLKGETGMKKIVRSAWDSPMA